MSTAQVQTNSAAHSGNRSRAKSPLVDYLAFTLLFASVSMAVAIALAGIVLLLVPSDSTGRIEANPAGVVQLSGSAVVSQAANQ